MESKPKTSLLDTIAETSVTRQPGAFVPTAGSDVAGYGRPSAKKTTVAPSFDFPHRPEREDEHDDRTTSPPPTSTNRPTNSPNKGSFTDIMHTALMSHHIFHEDDDPAVGSSLYHITQFMVAGAWVLLLIQELPKALEAPRHYGRSARSFCGLVDRT